jgi:hypothetical protein
VAQRLRERNLQNGMEGKDKPDASNFVGVPVRRFDRKDSTLVPQPKSNARQTRKLPAFSDKFRGNTEPSKCAEAARRT